MKTKTIVNRYKDKFTFTELEDGNVQWSGDFTYCRYGFPNDYTKAYKKYFEEECDPPHDHTLSLREFKEEVHRQIYDEDDNWVGPCSIAKKYGPLVESKKDVIDMVDPSGGPYMKAGMFIFEDRLIKEFKKNEQGYLIITEKVC
jgi:hypothetical protein